MYKADKLYNDMMDIDASIKDLEVKDEASIANYFELYTHLKKMGQKNLNHYHSY